MMSPPQQFGWMLGKLAAMGQTLQNYQESLTTGLAWKSDAVSLSGSDLAWRVGFFSPATSILTQAQEFSTKFGGGIADGFVSDIEEVVTAWNDLNEILEGSNYLFDTTVALEQFANTLGIEKPDITISRGDVNINLGLVVTMEAGQVAEVLVEKNSTRQSRATMGSIICWSNINHERKNIYF